MKRLLTGLLFLLIAGHLQADKAIAIKGEWQPDQVADGVYVIHGPLETPSPSNQGFMNNPGFVITDAGVVVVDPGGSVQVGEMLLEAIAQVTDKPVVAVFDTHVHGDHWLGNHAIHDKYPDVKIYAHPKMIESVSYGAGEEWMTMAMRMTDGAVAGTEVVNATMPVTEGDSVEIGGLVFDIYHNGKAHTNTDIMIHIPARQVMFLGDNASVNRLLRNEGSIKGNIEALENAAKTRTQVFVPGHGPSGPDASNIYKGYLKAAYAQVRKGYEDGMSDFEMKPMIAASLGGYKHWADFDRLLGKHINSIYMEIEAAEFQ
jgi:glyoxylase-like metal-dependent hydrolase (beta-lactamase superfamily II)